MVMGQLHLDNNPNTAEHNASIARIFHYFFILHLVLQSICDSLHMYNAKT